MSTLYRKAVIYIMRGLPASGKSTTAREMFEEEGIKRVSKDDLRAMLHSGKYTPELETFVLDVRNAVVELTVKKGFDIVVDDTNLNPVHVEALQDLAKAVGASVCIIDMTTPVDECIRRDAERAAPVGG